jgi:hypothetical protein
VPVIMPCVLLSSLLCATVIPAVAAIAPIESWRNSLGANGTLIANSCVTWSTIGTTLSSPDGASIYYAEMSAILDSGLYGVRISAADAAKGSVLWTWIDTTRTYAYPSSGPGISLTLSPDGSRLIAHLPLYNYNSGNSFGGASIILVNGFDAQTGAEVFSIQGGNFAFSMPLSSASRLPAISADGEYAFINGYDNGTISVRLIDPSTGVSRREDIVIAPLSADETDVAQCGLDVSGAILLVASYSAVSDAIVIDAFSTNTGFQLWSFSTHACTDTNRRGIPIALTSGALYTIASNVSTNTATIYGLALRDGADVLYVPAPTSLYLYTSAIAPSANDTLLFTRSDPSATAGTYSVALFDLTAAEEIWSWDLPGYGAAEIPALVSADGTAAFVGSLCVSEAAPLRSPCDMPATAYAITGLGTSLSAPSVTANPRGLGVFASVPVIEDRGRVGAAAVFIDYTEVGSGGLSAPKSWGLDAATGLEAWTTDTSSSVSFQYAGLVYADANHPQYFFVRSQSNVSSAATYLVAASIPSSSPAPSTGGNKNLFIYIGAGIGGLILFLGVVRAAASATRCCSHGGDAAREGSIDFMYDPLSHDSTDSGNASVWGKPPPPTARGFSFKKMFNQGVDSSYSIS